MTYLGREGYRYKNLCWPKSKKRVRPAIRSAGEPWWKGTLEVGGKKGGGGFPRTPSQEKERRWFLMKEHWGRELRSKKERRNPRKTRVLKCVRLQFPVGGGKFRRKGPTRAGYVLL